jgi:hypothetical protein
VVLVVSKCPACGRLKVIIGGDVFTVRTHATSKKNKVIVVLPVVQPQVATVKVKAKSDDRVMVDGIAIVQS